VSLSGGFDQMSPSRVFDGVKDALKTGDTETAASTAANAPLHRAPAPVQEEAAPEQDQASREAAKEAPGGEGGQLPPPAPPPPPKATMAAPSPQTAAKPPTDESLTLHHVTVYYGTDRTLEQKNGKLVYGALPSSKLDFGSVEVTLPPKHQKGVLER